MGKSKRVEKRDWHLAPGGKKGGPWHPCDDCIDPIAEALGEIVYKDWHAVGCAPPHPGAIMMMYQKDHCLEFLITWLKINISVEFAVDLDTMIVQPALQYLQLNSRAHEIKHGEKLTMYYSDQKNSENSVTPLLNEWREKLRTLPPEERETALADKNSPLVKIENQFRDIHEALQFAVAYLRRVSAVLRAKLADKEIERADVPVDVDLMTEPMTQTELGELFVVHRNKVKGQILDQYHHKKVGSKYRLRLADMPPAYHAQKPPAG